MTDYQESFIDNMKFYRKILGISQARLAEMCEVSNGTIGNIECGKTKPSFDLIFTIADKLGIKPEELFKIKDEYNIEESLHESFTEAQLSRINKTVSTALSQAVENAMKQLEQNHVLTRSKK